MRSEPASATSMAASPAALTTGSLRGSPLARSSTSPRHDATARGKASSCRTKRNMDPVSDEAGMARRKGWWAANERSTAARRTSS